MNVSSHGEAKRALAEQFPDPFPPPGLSRGLWRGCDARSAEPSSISCPRPGDCTGSPAVSAGRLRHGHQTPQRPWEGSWEGRGEPRCLGKGLCVPHACCCPTCAPGCVTVPQCLCSCADTPRGEGGSRRAFADQELRFTGEEGRERQEEACGDHSNCIFNLNLPEICFKCET